MGGLFSSPKPPPVEPPPPPPEPAPLPAPEGDAKVKLAKNRKIAEQRKRGGFDSTILSQGEKLGSGSGGYG